MKCKTTPKTTEMGGRLSDALTRATEEVLRLEEFLNGLTEAERKVFSDAVLKVDRMGGPQTLTWSREWLEMGALAVAIRNQTKAKPLEEK